MNATNLILVALGGALGSVLRALVSSLAPSDSRLPWATICINIVGSFAIGCLMGKLGSAAPGQDRWQSFLMVGLCGGFTTFSTFSWQTLDMLTRNQVGAALLNILLSVTLCLVATWIGWRLMR